MEIKMYYRDGDSFYAVPLHKKVAENVKDITALTAGKTIIRARIRVLDDRRNVYVIADHIMSIDSRHDGTGVTITFNDGWSLETLNGFTSLFQVSSIVQ